MPICFAGQTVMLRRYRAHDMMPAICIGGFATFLIAGLFGGGFHVTLHEVLILAAMGPLQLAIPLIFYGKGARSVPAVALSLIVMLDVILNPLWSWIGVGEEPPLSAFIGGAIIIAAVILCIAGERVFAFRANLAAGGRARRRKRIGFTRGYGLPDKGGAKRRIAPRWHRSTTSNPVPGPAAADLRKAGCGWRHRQPGDDRGDAHQHRARTAIAFAPLATVGCCFCPSRCSCAWRSTPSTACWRASTVRRAGSARYLNELSDVISDAALYLPFALVAPLSPIVVLAVVSPDSPR